MNYWLDLFAGTTWREFRDAGANVSGFRAKQVKTAKQMRRGDIFLCYLTGVMRWVGALEIVGTSSDARKIWQEQDFPVRFEVQPLIVLDPEHGIPMEQLEGRVKFYAGPKDRGKFKGFVRSSLRKFDNPKDGVVTSNTVYSQGQASTAAKNSIANLHTLENMRGQFPDAAFGFDCNWQPFRPRVWL